MELFKKVLWPGGVDETRQFFQKFHFFLGRPPIRIWRGRCTPVLCSFLISQRHEDDFHRKQQQNGFEKWCFEKSPDLHVSAVSSHEPRWSTAIRRGNMEGGDNEPRCDWASSVDKTQ